MIYFYHDHTIHIKHICMIHCKTAIMYYEEFRLSSVTVNLFTVMLLLDYLSLIKMSCEMHTVCIPITGPSIEALARAIS